MGKKIIDVFTDLPVSRQRKHQLRNPEWAYELRRKYKTSEKGRETQRKYQKRWRENNPDYHKEWLKKHPNYRKEYYAKRAGNLRVRFYGEGLFGIINTNLNIHICGQV